MSAGRRRKSTILQLPNLLRPRCYGGATQYLRRCRSVTSVRLHVYEELPDVEGGYNESRSWNERQLSQWSCRDHGGNPGMALRVAKPVANAITKSARPRKWNDRELVVVSRFWFFFSASAVSGAATPSATSLKPAGQSKKPGRYPKASTARTEAAEDAPGLKVRVQDGNNVCRRGAKQ